MTEQRDGYGFSSIDKEVVHKRARNRCEFEDCPLPNNNIVHHLEAVFIAKLDDKPKEVIHDVTQNALMLCDQDAFNLDRQQDYQVDCLLYERHQTRANTRTKRPYKSNSSKRRRR
jgi:hypothetical protein